MWTVPIGESKTVQQFTGQIRLVLATTKGAHLSCDKIQYFSARARDYIGAYHHLQNVACPTKQSVSKITTLSMKDIKEMKKIYHLYRDVERSNTVWCSQNAEVPKVANQKE
eukprot:15324705-Ditylum_brightwellii.AAC.1